MRHVAHIFPLLSFAILFPAPALAQLSSTNYQVDVQYVGEEGGGYATSTSYQLGGSEGTPYEYVPSSSTPEEAPVEGGSTGSRARAATTAPAETTVDMPSEEAGSGAYVPGGEDGDSRPVPEEREDLHDGSGGTEGEDSISEEVRDSVERIMESIIPPGSPFREIVSEHPFLSSLFLLLILLMILVIPRYVRESRKD